MNRSMSWHEDNTMKKNGVFDRLCGVLVILTVISVSAPPVCFIMDSFVGGAMYFMFAVVAVFGDFRIFSADLVCPYKTYEKAC